MARTHGHGNPDWTRDETILALALYLETGEAVPSKKDSRVQRLSSTLRALPYHAEAARRETFRNQMESLSSSRIYGAWPQVKVSATLLPWIERSGAP